MDLNETIGKLNLEIKETIKLANELGVEIKQSTNQQESISLVVQFMAAIIYLAVLITTLVNLLNGVINSLIQPIPICVAETQEEKINWFLGNKIYKTNPEYRVELLFNPEIKIYKQNK